LALLKTTYHVEGKELRGYITAHPVLSYGEQAEMLGVSRSNLYYQPKPVIEKTVVVMNKIDEVYTAYPFYGSRRIAKEVGLQLGVAVNRKRVQGLMQEMGIQAIYPKPNLSKSNPAHRIYPYLLKGVTAGYPNHIWGTDITYIRMKHGFVYLVAYLDWFSRYILSWRLSTTLEIAFVLDAAVEALQRHGAPEIENNDQGSHFTSEQHIQLFEEKGTKISMDHRGRAYDNIFTERLWRTIKYEEVYLKSYQTVSEAKENMEAYIYFYNNKRLHQSLGYKTPREIFEQRR
jgi:putative transposase